MSSLPSGTRMSGMAVFLYVDMLTLACWTWLPSTPPVEPWARLLRVNLSCNCPSPLSPSCVCVCLFKYEWHLVINSIHFTENVCKMLQIIREERPVAWQSKARTMPHEDLGAVESCNLFQPFETCSLRCQSTALDSSGGIFGILH
jgi:hypothetical protein